MKKILSFIFEACDVNQIFREIETEFGESSYGKEKYSEAYKFMKPKELRSLYYPYHSLDPAQAIERILEAKDLNEEDFTARGVKIMRNIMKEEKE